MPLVQSEFEMQVPPTELAFVQIIINNREIRNIRFGNEIINIF